MRRILALAVLVGFAVAFFGAQARAAQPGEETRRQEFAENHPIFHWYLEALGKLRHEAREMNLTPEQRQQLHQVFMTNKPAIETVVKELRDARHALHAAVVANKDEATIRAAATAVGAAIGDGAVLRAKIRQQVLAVLTADQVKIFENTAPEFEKGFDNAFEQHAAQAAPATTPAATATPPVRAK